jgi:calcineurin-like phosphoesterase family protein
VRSFFIADLHFGDDRYTRCGGHLTPARPFADAEEMDHALIDRWNEVVEANDLVWVLGDVGRPHALWKVSKLKGEKRLILGNCDRLEAVLAADLFSAVFASKRIDNLLLSHIPVHPSELKAGGINIHGHLHGRKLSDQRYVCVSVDQTEFRPLELNALLRRPP